jgi:sulfite dehydrogenase
MKLVSKIFDAMRALPLRTLPGKQSLIRLSRRPPNYETPPALLGSPITRNDIFFVRYHLPIVPKVDADNWRMKIGGDGARTPASINLEELRSMPATEITAVCECSGNQRRFIAPPAPGVQWGHGAVGCARWKGARLRDVLEKAGLTEKAIEIAFEGGDEDPSGKTEPYIKSIPLARALEENTLVVYEMSGEPLPHWNGFPARIVIPGWTATYWVKQLRSIKAITKPCQSFWMKDDYRVPLGRFSGDAFESQNTKTDTAITSILVNSLITSHEENSKIPAGKSITLSGVAWGCGHGIDRVEISSDSGKNWSKAELGGDFGRFAFRPFSFTSGVLPIGNHSFLVRATNKNGESQPSKPIPNPAGYHYNAVQSLKIVAA